MLQLIIRHDRSMLLRVASSGESLMIEHLVKQSLEFSLSEDGTRGVIHIDDLGTISFEQIQVVAHFDRPHAVRFVAPCSRECVSSLLRQVMGLKTILATSLQQEVRLSMIFTVDQILNHQELLESYIES